jgi:hypothetical protein
MEHNQYTQVSESQITDPIIKLLDDVKTRKTKVRIPNFEDLIPSLYNDRTIKKSVSIETTIRDTSPKFEKPIRWPRILRNLRSPDFPTAQQKIILTRLEKVPAYRIVTNAQQIVMATPRDEQYSTLFDWLYMKYYNLCVWTEDDGPISLTLFFVNKGDAQLYLQAIAKDDPRSAEKTNLQVQVTNLATYYRSQKTSSPGTKAVLVQDLKEVSDLVLTYIPTQPQKVHPKQKYSKSMYKGQPIYLMKPLAAKLFYKKSIMEYSIDYLGRTHTKNIFFRLEDAYSAWDKFCDDNGNGFMGLLNIALVPEIEIYNLESYLLDLEDSDIDVVEDNFFMATPNAIKDKKQQLEIVANTDEPRLKEKVKQCISNGSKKLGEVSKGMLWLLTSDTLPAEGRGW